MSSQRYPDNTLTTSNLDKANLFASDLKTRVILHPYIFDVANLSLVELSPYQTLPMSLPTQHIFSIEIQFIVKKLPDKKSPGHNLRTNPIIK